MTDRPTITVDPDRLARLDSLTLASGAHDPPNGAWEGCVMEAASWIAGEEWSDSPECVSPVIAAFMRRWNDDLDDEGRQRLKPYVRRALGTRDDHDEGRAWMATDWFVRVHTPAWLELAGVTEAAEALRGLPPLSAETAKAAQPTINDAREQGAAGDAARAAAGDAAGAAAWAALAPTKQSLQESARDLLDRMIALGADEREVVVADA